MTKYSTYEGEEITVVFSTEGEMTDYGVPRSPVFWVPTDIEIESVEILGVRIKLSTLPKELLDTIYDLTDELDDWHD